MCHLPLARCCPDFYKMGVWDKEIFYLINDEPPGLPRWRLVAKTPPVTAGDIWGTGPIPGLRRSPGGGHSGPLQYSAWRVSLTEKPGGLLSMGSQRVRHNWNNSTYTCSTCKPPLEQLDSHIPSDFSGESQPVSHCTLKLQGSHLKLSDCRDKDTFHWITVRSNTPSSPLTGVWDSQFTSGRTPFTNL